ncbi:MAG: hypothetical protein E6845_03175 [Clostridium sp.]|uniref:hypothetical protein n=1 Tax=Clostridium sp. TaxID=1506 RepID=UPI002902734D|nr:hypothetical protein [Clostridium sp.]MDU1601939.1 hypothetical protein [Clostridium sp.]
MEVILKKEDKRAVDEFYNFIKSLNIKDQNRVEDIMAGYKMAVEAMNIKGKGVN